MKWTILVVLMLFFTSCAFLTGETMLGNHFALVEADKDDITILYCTSGDGSCTSGIHVVPHSSGYGSLNIDAVNYDKKWIVARSVQVKDKSIHYWIINKDFRIDIDSCELRSCDSTIQAHVTGPLDSVTFAKAIQELNINLKLQ